MSISDVKGLEDGSWVNEPIIGRISSAANHVGQESGKRFSTAKLGDESDTIDVVSFTKSLTNFDNKIVELAGKGNKKSKNNKGYDQIIVGKNAIITPQDGDAPAPVKNSDGYKNQPNPTYGPAKTAAPKLTLESLADDFTGKLVVGYNIAESIVAELDGRVELTSEDRRSIAISFIIEANRRGL